MADRRPPRRRARRKRPPRRLSHVRQLRNRSPKRPAAKHSGRRRRHPGMRRSSGVGKSLRVRPPRPRPYRRRRRHARRKHVRQMMLADHDLDIDAEIVGAAKHLHHSPGSRLVAVGKFE